MHDNRMNLKAARNPKKDFLGCSKLQQLIKEVERLNNIKDYDNSLNFTSRFQYKLQGIKQTVEADNEIENAINKFYNREITMLEFDKFVNKWLEQRQKLKKLVGVK